ncbi:hypothetical protein [Sandaracinus amylolyticus]|uniref:hypothetical protein n=1 Tax=Sandaracinus amylolyticus TaxID=927083 RepID=UPI001F27429E|nr:hypothetical protein [Sandaracinus amylolyticus]UJR80261.1 Hypothetical protein I5071_23050 [Sandaracinus amylolyticus]
MSRSILASLVLLAACGTERPCDVADLAPISRAPAFGVVLSDYASTAIALLDEDGDAITESWIDSGTRASGIAAGLGGDVVVVATPEPGTLALLERFNADRLTLAAYATGAVRQIDLRGDDPEAPSGHSPNVQDVLAIDGPIALVARANPSFHPDAPELARGNDVVVVDVAQGLVLTRIDLAADTSAPDGTPIYARPTTLVPIAHSSGARRVLVGLQRLSADFTLTGDGALAVVDPVARARAELVTLDGLSGCHGVRAIPGVPDRAMILCTGDAFAPGLERRREAGIARVAIDPDGRITLDRVWRASDHESAPSPTTGLVSLDASRAIYVADPRGESGRDVVALLDLDAASTAILLEAEASFVLGSGALDPARGLLLVPDADARGVHRLDVDADGVTLRDFVLLPTCRTLPPREITQL